MAKGDLNWARWIGRACDFYDKIYQSFLTLSSPTNPIAGVDPVTGKA